METLEAQCHDVENLEIEAPVPNILDVLNEDCFNAVLDYLDIDDIVRSERVSRGWQQLVLAYLAGVKSFYYGSKHPTDKNYRRITLEREVRGVKRRHFPNFGKMLKALSPYFVKLYLGTTGSWRLSNYITLEVDTLEELTLYRIEGKFLEHVEFKNCKRLKRLALESCSRLYDRDLVKLINSNDIEELSLNQTHDISGEFMINLETNIKYLTINKCWELTLPYVLKSTGLLSALTKLEFSSNPLIKMVKLHLVVAKTPRLEWLCLNGYKTDWGRVASTKLIKAIGRLTELKHFCMNFVTTDALLETLALRCKALRSVHMEFSPVSGPAVVSLCRDLPDLKELNVCGCRDVSEDDLVACIANANLTMLDASYCSRVSVNLVAAAARDVRKCPRRFQLRLCKSVRDVDRDSFKEERQMGLEVA